MCVCVCVCVCVMYGNKHILAQTHKDWYTIKPKNLTQPSSYKITLDRLTCR